MRHSRQHAPTAALALAACLLAIAPAANAFDFGVHVLPGGTLVSPTLSFDGQVVGARRTLYSQNGATPLIRTGYYSPPSILALNDDGSIFGGTYQGGGVGNVGTIDRGPGDFTQIGQSAQQSEISVDAISGDGSIGLVNHWRPTSHSSYLVQSDGTVLPNQHPAGGFVYGTDVSRDGQIAVGYSLNESGGPSPAYRYRAGLGYEEFVHPSALNQTRAWGVSADGSIILGDYDDRFPFLLQDNVFTDLTIDHALYSYARADEMNDDATTIVGFLTLANVTPTQIVGGIWLHGRGWLNAQDHFASLGIFMPEGRTIVRIEEVSSNGQTFLGTFDNGESFVVSIPAPSSLALLGLAAIASRRRRS